MKYIEQLLDNGQCRTMGPGRKGTSEVSPEMTRRPGGMASTWEGGRGAPAEKSEVRAQSLGLWMVWTSSRKVRSARSSRNVRQDPPELLPNTRRLHRLGQETTRAWDRRLLWAFLRPGGSRAAAATEPPRLSLRGRSESPEGPSSEVG